MKHHRVRKCKDCGKKLYSKATLCPECYRDRFHCSLMFIKEQEVN